MKTLLILGVLAIMAWSCSPAKQTGKSFAIIKEINQDSSEYEVVIIDPAFDHWYLVNYGPAKDYPNHYYKNKNQVAASNWNYYFRSGKYREIINGELNYLPETEYGIDVNRKLYWYFKFIEENYKIRLLS
jgi:hypothetical protein